MNRLSSLIVLSLCLATLVTAQTNFYFVSFTDKEGSDHIALSDKALSLREARAIAIDNLDWAVSSVYLDSLRHCGARICHTSRWHNGATVEMTPTLAEEMAAWTFVRDVECTRRLTLEESEAPVLARRKQLLVEDEPTEEEEEGPSYPALQLEMLHLNDLHERGFKGLGKTIAVIDACYARLVAFLVVGFDAFYDTRREVFHSRLRVAGKKLFAVDLYLLYLLTVDGYLAIVAYLCSRKTLH